MQEKIRSKEMQPRDTLNKGSNIIEEYHFPGGGEYEPMTIEATSRESAEAEWLQRRRKVNKEN